MIATWVEDRLTPFTDREAQKALRDALYAYLGSVQPSDEVLALASAKCALETGNFQKIHGYNFGNKKHPSTEPGMYGVFACDEILSAVDKRDGKPRGRVWFEPDGREKDRFGWSHPIKYVVPPGHPQCRFSVYAGKTDGAYRYIEFVATRKRYSAARQALLSGNPDAYVRELKRAGYFTAPEEQYRVGVVSLFRKHLAIARGQDDVTEPHGIDWEGCRAVVWNLQSDYARDVVTQVRAEGMKELTGHESTLPKRDPNV